MAHTFTRLLTHVVFSTKDRVPSLDVDLKVELFAYMSGIVSNQRGKALLINGPTDHVHLLLSLPATLALSDSVRLIKTNSSKWVHEKFSRHASFGWQTGFGGFSVSSSNAEEVVKYIQDQEFHHRKMTFKEEFIGFLKKNNIEYDERYIWE